MKKSAIFMMFVNVHFFYASDELVLFKDIKISSLIDKQKFELANKLGCYVDCDEWDDSLLLMKHLDLNERARLFNSALDAEDLDGVLTSLMDFSINSKGLKTGNTPLIVLIKKACDVKGDESFKDSYKKYVKIFIDFGASLSLVDLQGRKAADWAEFQHKEYLLPYLLKKLA